MAKTKSKIAVPDGWFKWERPGLDFPFYNDETVPLWQGWLLFATGIAVELFLALPFLEGSGRLVTALAVLLIPLIPLLYVAHGDLGTVIKKPRLADIPLVIGVVVLDYLYVFVMVIILKLILNLDLEGNAVLGETMDGGFYALVFVQLFGEELFKTNMLLGIMMVVFRKTGNRKLGMVVGTAVCLAIFGIAHMGAYGGKVLQILLIQGAGSIICVFAYLKTKNMLVTYVAHVLIDVTAFWLSSLDLTALGTALALALL